jgi:ubiquitin carboxyl-terminal hydrolase 4/11
MNTKPSNGRKKFKKGRTYGKGGNKRMRQQQREMERRQRETFDIDDQPETEDTGYDGGPLVRLKEGIVVDWSEGAFDEIWKPSLWESCETLADSVLDKAQASRTKRRKHGISIEACLDEFERDEILSEQDMWYCPRCKEHRRASKKFDLWKTPDILVMHLKRFSSSGWRRDKLDVLVDFPIENLDITNRVLHKEDGKQEVYDLIGVDCHWGGLGGGHYTAHAKNFIDGQWYTYNGTFSQLSCQRLLTWVRLFGVQSLSGWHCRCFRVPTLLPPEIRGATWGSSLS